MMENTTVMHLFQHSSFNRELSAGCCLLRSPNHRGWKGHLEIPQSKPQLKQVSYCSLHRKASKWVLNIFREADLKFFHMFVWNFPCSCLFPLHLFLLLGTVIKSLAPTTSLPAFRYVKALVCSPLSLLYAKQSQVFQPFTVTE